MRRISIVPILALVLACGPEIVSAGDESGTETGEEFLDGRTLVQVFEPHRRAPRVDMILVVDDSPSMRPFTERWAINASAFAMVMAADDVTADIRIAITTTSVPGPTCTGPRAHGGEPNLDSCRAHLPDFVGPDEHGELGGQVEDLAGLCQTSCSLDQIPLVPSPGSDEHDLDTLALRPWIEAPHNPFGGNLDGVTLDEALTCVGLQGFGGCTYESPIEAAARMVEHMHDDAHPMSQFRRPDALLYITTIGDEDDCSHPAASATIFDPDGARSFWADPQADTPTSAVCINAGLECDEDSCALTDHALDGAPTNDPANAVLTPTSRLHSALLAAGELDDEDWEPMITNVGGFRSDGAVVYNAPGPDLSADEQTYLDGFGVLPGCQGPLPNQAPPLRAGPGGRLAAAGSEYQQYSICDPDWSPAIEGFAQRIGPGLIPGCIQFACVDDCVLEEVTYDDIRIELPACLRDDAGWVVDLQTNSYVIPDDDTDSCWVWLTDANQLTSDPYDDLSDSCVDQGAPGEVVIVRRPGSYFPYDSVHELRCRPCEG